MHLFVHNTEIKGVQNWNCPKSNNQILSNRTISESSDYV